MSKQVSIAVSSPDCVTSYLVQYKVVGQVGFTFQQTYFASPIVLENLADSTDYEVSITPNCCDGTVGTPTITTFNTDPPPTPTSFNVAQVGIDAQGTWDNMLVDDYEWQRASNAAFTTGLTAIFQTGGLTTFTDVNPGAGTWWYRVRSVDNSVAGAWATDSVTIV